MKNLFNIRINKGTSLALISLLYLAMSNYLFQQFGVKFVNDSPRYIGYASGLNDGFYFDPLNFWYFTYVVLVYLHQLFAESLLPIVITQYLIGYLAVLSIFKSTFTLSRNHFTASLACMIFILFPDNIFWHSYILTESLYSSFLCFSWHFLIKYKANKSSQNLTLLSLCLLVCFFCKPTAPALITSFVAPLTLRFLSIPPYQWLKYTGLVILTVVGFLLANKMITMHFVMFIYSQGDIIFAMHEFPNHQFHDLLTITPPEDLYVPVQGDAPLVNVLEFIIHNPIYWLKMALGKLIMYITHIRPYWSWMHNLMVVITLWPCYYFAVRAIRKKAISKDMVITMLSYGAIHTLVVCTTWADWDARFFVPLYPVIATVGALGLQDWIIKRIQT